MTARDLEHYISALGYVVEIIIGRDGQSYSVVRELTIPAGGLCGRICDVGVQRAATEPYTVPAAIHTRPALVRMDMVGSLKTQASPIGDDWQYWSRRYDRIPTPKGIWVHVLTVLTELPAAA